MTSVLWTGSGDRVENNQKYLHADADFFLGLKNKLCFNAHLSTEK